MLNSIIPVPKFHSSETTWPIFEKNARKYSCCKATLFANVDANRLAQIVLKLPCSLCLWTICPVHRWSTTGLYTRSHTIYIYKKYHCSGTCSYRRHWVDSSPSLCNWLMLPVDRWCVLIPVATAMATLCQHDIPPSKNSHNYPLRLK